MWACIILFTLLIFVAVLLCCNSKVATIIGGALLTPDIMYNISSRYAYRDEYLKLLSSEIKKTHAPVIIVDDIKHRLPYQHSNRLLKPQVHIGQRKLFLSEIQFLTENPSKYCLYAGSAPGHKTHLLSQHFPDIKFILIDPNKFDLMLPDMTSHRKKKHPDIIHLKHDYPTESNIGPLTLDFIHNSNYKLYIIEDYMTNEYAELFKSINDMTFISDIRTSVDPALAYPSDFDIVWNSSMMFNWITVLQPLMTMLKFRPLYFNTEFIDKSMPDFELSKKYGIDFIEAWKHKKYIMPKSKLYIQAWAGRTSSELRMWISKSDLANLIEYDSNDIESAVFYFNNVDRGLCYHINNNSNEEYHFCHCNDCALENNIWENYINKYAKNKNVIDFVIKLGEITRRPLNKVHPNVIFNKTPNISKFVKVNALLELKEQERFKRSKNIRHKGDSGQKV